MEGHDPFESVRARLLGALLSLYYPVFVSCDIFILLALPYVFYDPVAVGVGVIEWIVNLFFGYMISEFAFPDVRSSGDQ